MLRRGFKVLLEEKVAIITGGAKGIGRGIGLKFASEGCSVVVADILTKEGNETVKELSEKGPEAMFVKCDHTDSSQVQDMAKKVISKYGKIDILVNNAGGFGPPNSFFNVTEEEWDRRLDLNLKGVFLCVKAIAPHMMERRSGRIINIASIAAITAGPACIEYGSAKGGVVSLTINLCLELAPYNITVNAILPGGILTDMFRGSSGVTVGENEDIDKILQERMAKTVPLGRIGTPEDIAGAALFFASDLSSFVTGDRIIVGGGLPIMAPH
jgi:3-oxoacyl-[acyl-carrier protein] reductase